MRRSYAVIIGLVVVGLVTATFLGRRGGPQLPVPGSPRYEDVTRAFFRGLASLEVGLLENALSDFAQATELADGEPAAWGNLGLTHARLGAMEPAVAALDRAAQLAPDSSDVALVQGQTEIMRGGLDQGLRHLQRAVELDVSNHRARFAFAEQLERSGRPTGDVMAAEQLDQLLRALPGNLLVLLERTRLAIKLGDAARLAALLPGLEAFRSVSPTADEQYQAVATFVAAADYAAASRAIAFLRNVLAPTAAFQDSLAAVGTPLELIAQPFARFLRMTTQGSIPSPPDAGLTFSRVPIEAGLTTRWTAALAVALDGGDTVAVVATDGREIRRVEGNGPRTSLIGTAPNGAIISGLLALDSNNDFRLDLATAGTDGVRLFIQSPDGRFTDGTPAARDGDWVIEAAVAVWAADIEMDGDLDIVVALRAGSTVALRNNGDGTWRRFEPFAGVSDVRAFMWADLDHDGDPDAVLLDARGSLYLFENGQAARLFPMTGPELPAPFVAAAVADFDANGAFDLVTLDTAGVMRLSTRDADGWRTAELATWTDGPARTAGSYRLLVADVDNNGALDLIASGPAGSFLALGGGTALLPLAASVADVAIFDLADLDGDGHLDVVASAGGASVRLLGRGQANYHWQIIRPRAQQLAGDQRINSFGFGGEVEIRSGLLVQKQSITTTSVHFGLGERTHIDLARILWPNGVKQAEFDRPADEVITAEQRLKGSCPWVFTYDGRGMRFVTDFLWRSPLGLRINAQASAPMNQTEDWIKVRGDQLVPREGVYDVRITADLWETHFIDHVSLMVVDHPEDVDIFVDERFSADPAPLAVQATRTPRSVSKAWDHEGQDVTALVAHQDGRYLGRFNRGAYQGVADEHDVVFALDREIPRDAPLWLVAHGWIYPTDSSINVAIGQGGHPKPRGLTLEVEDDAGQWRVVYPDLGFPAGKNKTILIDLRAVNEAGLTGPRRLRLRTNLEIHWDWLAYAEGAGDVALQTTRLYPGDATLRYRGYSQTVDAGRDVPEVPVYDKLGNVGQRWRDLEGYYTRFGDVRPLLQEVDDRYVIMNAGDELRLEFPVPPPPPSGWRRDFVLVGDGWVKDGDFNTTFSKTVHPLPSHVQPEYDWSAREPQLREDPVYLRHARDWEEFHTRFVTPRHFLNTRHRQP